MLTGGAEQATQSGADHVASVDICPSELLFRTEDGRDVEAGPWALDLVTLGRMFAAAECAAPLTFALSLPILDFAGPLSAAGFIAERARRRLDRGAGFPQYAAERAQLFRQLCALPPGTPVLLRLASGETVHAVFLGVSVIDGQQWARIRFQKKTKGAGQEFINEAKVLRVIFVAGLSANAAEDLIGKAANVRLGLAEGFMTKSPTAI